MKTREKCGVKKTKLREKHILSADEFYSIHSHKPGNYVFAVNIRKSL